MAWRLLLASVVVIAASVGLSAAAVAGDDLVLRGEFVLGQPRHWKRGQGQSCSGSGLYGDVRRGTRIQVRDEESDVLATSALSSGQSEGRAGCRFSFVMRDVSRPLPSESYTVEIGEPGKAGLVYRESLGGAYLARVGRMLTFRVG